MGGFGASCVHMGYKNPYAGCTLLVLICLAASPAASQVTRNIGIAAAAGAEYDSNVARTSAAAASARGLKRSDVRFTTGLDLDITVPRGRQTLFLRGTAGYVSYARNGRLNRERLDLTGGVDAIVGPCRPKFTAGYARAQSQLEDLDLQVERIKNTEERRSLRLESRCGRGIGLEPQAAVSGSWVRNGALIQETSDYNNFEASGGLAYSGPTIGTLSLTGSYSKTRYPKRLVLIGADSLHDGYELYSGGIRYERQIGSRIRGDVGAAYSSLHSDIPDVANTHGVTYGAHLQLQPSYRLQARLNFDRQLLPSNRLNVSYVRAKTIGAEAEYAFGTRLRMSVGGVRRERSNRQSDLLVTTGPTDERFTTFTGRLRFEQSRRFSFELNAAHEKRETDVPLFDYISKRVGLTAKARF